MAKVSLIDVRRMDIFKQIDPPETVYHMTDKDNVESILNVGKIRTGKDFMCFFFENEENVVKYIVLSNALKGRKYYDFDGRVHTAPPLNIEHTVVLKLIPRKVEPLAWFREDNEKSRQHLPAAQRAKSELFDSTRICHYDDFRFARDPEIIELSDIMEKYPYKEPNWRMQNNPVKKMIDSLKS